MGTIFLTLIMGRLPMKSYPMVWCVQARRPDG